MCASACPLCPPRGQGGSARAHTHPRAGQGLSAHAKNRMTETASLAAAPFGDTPVGRLFASRRAYAQTRLAEFRELLSSTDHVGQHCADEMLCRFIESNLVVRGMVVKDASLQAAADMLANNMRWRVEHNADQLRSCPHCDADPFAHCLFNIGTDRRGWALAYSCAGRTTMKDPSSITQHLIAFLEQTFAQPNAPTHFCLLLDLHGFGLGDLDPRVAIRSITVLLKHYPDRVAQVAMLDAPFVFKGIWNILKQVVDPLSQQKATMLTRGPVMDEYLATYLQPQQEAFVRDMLRTRARPHFDSFSPLCAGVRVSLGPCDAFTAEMRKRYGSDPATAQDVGAPGAAPTVGLPTAAVDPAADHSADVVEDQALFQA